MPLAKPTYEGSKSFTFFIKRLVVYRVGFLMHTTRLIIWLEKIMRHGFAYYPFDNRILDAYYPFDNMID